MKYNKQELLDLKQECRGMLEGEEEPDVMSVVGYLETIMELCDELLEYQKE